MLSRKSLLVSTAFVAFALPGAAAAQEQAAAEAAATAQEIAANAETENRNIINCFENFIIWIAPDKFGRINISLKNSNAYYVAAEVIVSSI